MAEDMFSRLVPDALDANAYIRRNNPGFDFYFGDLTIDVKYSKFYKKGEHEYWGIRVNWKLKKQIFIVCPKTIKRLISKAHERKNKR